ncbi:MAG: hypothetical protein JWQ10_1490 [Herbaspirillum sp.]|nr:hypothetical protein [Herbaspirillum sp.]
MFRSIRWMLSASLCCQILAGCGGVYQTYGSEATAKSDMALMEFPNRAKSEARIKEIDGKWLGITDFDQYQLAPGEHSITAEISSARYFSKPLTHRFRAEPGKIYQFKAYVDNTEMKWDIGIFEKETQQRIDFEKMNVLRASFYGH